MGTTVRVASMRDDGQTFHDSRTPAPRLYMKQMSRAALTVALLDVLKVEHGTDRSSSSSKSTCRLDNTNTGKQIICMAPTTRIIRVMTKQASIRNHRKEASFSNSTSGAFRTQVM